MGFPLALVVVVFVWGALACVLRFVCAAVAIPTTLAIIRRIVTGATERGVPFTNEGMTVRGGTLYLLPEDDDSRLFQYKLP